MTKIMVLALALLTVTLLGAGCAGNSRDSSQEDRTVVVPQVTGKSRESAERIASESQLALALKEEYDGNVPAGNIISQEPAAGNRVSAGSVVEVVVSKGIGRRSAGAELEETNTGRGWVKRCTRPSMGPRCPHAAYH